MKIPAKAHYALALMTDLALHDAGGPVPVRDIAFRLGVSQKYLEQVIAPLCREGLVRSARGTGGGYRLDRLPREYTAGEILSAAGGGFGYDPPGDGRAAGFWQGLFAAVNGYLDGVTLESLAERENQAGNDYCI